MAESVCYKRGMLERSMSRGEAALSNWRAASKRVGSYSAPPVVHQRPQQYVQQVDGCTPYSEQGIQQYAIVELDISRFLTPGGFFEYLKLKYPDIVSNNSVDWMLIGSV